MYKLLKYSLLFTLILIASTTKVFADDYIIDSHGAHAFVQFRVKHLGYSWLYGRFNEFDGEFYYDPKKPEKNQVSITIKLASLDSNHAVRDKHLRGSKYLNTERFPNARFYSTSYEDLGGGKALVHGVLDFYGHSNDLIIPIQHIGGGRDPWGGYRQGFEGAITIKPARWGLDLTQRLGPAAEEVELILSVEGIRKKTLRAKR